MKIIKALFLLLSVSLLFAHNLQAQARDYVITIKGDTLKGQFIGKRFKADTWDKASKVDPTQYQETYRAAGHDLARKVFMSKNSDPVFLPVLIRGKITLYQKIVAEWTLIGTQQMYNATTHLYVAKGTDTVTELDYSGPLNNVNIAFNSKKTGMDVLAEMLMDNKNVYDKFVADNKFNMKHVKNIIHLYDTGRPMGSDVNGDYVIKNKKDTIFCEVEPATMNTMARYRVSEMDRFIRIDTSINEYFLSDNSSTYVLKTLPKNSRRQYVKVLIKGRINLYSYSMNNTAEDSEASLFAEKQPGQLVQIKHVYSRPDKEEKKAFADLISDNPKLVDKAKNPPSDFKSIFENIMTYNSDYSSEGGPAN